MFERLKTDSLTAEKGANFEKSLKTRIIKWANQAKSPRPQRCLLTYVHSNEMDGIALNSWMTCTRHRSDMSRGL